MAHLVRVVTVLLALLVLLGLPSSVVQAQSCSITNFSISATSVSSGTHVNVSGSGQCSSFNAMRFGANGNYFLEGTTPPSLSGYWIAAGSGNISLCFQITSGDWNNSSQTATSCQNVFVSGGSDSGGGGNSTNPDTNTGGGGSGSGNGSSGGQSCSSQASSLWVGAIARVNQSVGVRDSVDGSRFDELSTGKLITIVGGPDCRGNNLIWNVGYDGRQGWVTEIGQNGNYNLLPNNGGGNSGGGSGSGNGAGSTSPTAVPPITGSSTGCNQLSRLQIGDLARVSDETPDPVPQRSDHSTSANVLQQIPVNDLVIVTGGPYCEGNFVWWLVRYNGTTGWSAEINRFNNYNLIWVQSGEDEGDSGRVFLKRIPLSPENMGYEKDMILEVTEAGILEYMLSVTYEQLPDNNQYRVRTASLQYFAEENLIVGFCSVAAGLVLYDEFGKEISLGQEHSLFANLLSEVQYLDTQPYIIVGSRATVQAQFIWRCGMTQSETEFWQQDMEELRNQSYERFMSRQTGGFQLHQYQLQIP